MRRSDKIELIISILFRRAWGLVYNFFLSGFIVVKLKSHQQNRFLIKLNKIINVFVFESFSNDVYRYTF